MSKIQEVEMPGVMRTLMKAMGYTEEKAFVEDTAEELLDDLPFSELMDDLDDEWEDDNDWEDEDDE